MPGEPTMPTEAGQKNDAEKPKEEKIYMRELDKAGYTRLEGAWNGMFNGMRDVENIMLDGDISEEDFAAFKRVLRGVTLYMNEYKNEQEHSAANADNEKIVALEKKIKEMKGTANDAE